MISNSLGAWGYGSRLNQIRADKIVKAKDIHLNLSLPHSGAKRDRSQTPLIQLMKVFGSLYGL